ncbi:MAG: DUF2156 domain-containing protein [Acidobacteria bacterium]|nr:DUF2156 domain-containing protein [Acidobacteriota bacterium]
MTDPFLFLGREFRRVDLADQALLEGFYRRFPQPLSGFTFAAQFAWRIPFAHAWALLDPDTLLITTSHPNDPPQGLNLLQPVGLFPPESQARLLAEIGRLAEPLRIVCVSRAFIDRHPEFVRHFTVAEDRAFANYVYRSEDLAELAGRRYAKKRNLIAQTRELYTWQVERLTAATVPDCLDACREVSEPVNANVNRLLRFELDALKETLAHFGVLRQDGILLRVGGTVAGMAVFEPIAPDTAAVHFEKADRRHKGIYQVLNMECARLIRDLGFLRINREEDLGEPGLRQAKLSYHPSEIVPAYTLAFTGGPSAP